MSLRRRRARRGGYAVRGLDLREHTVRLVEELRHDVVPATDGRDGEQAARRRELVRRHGALDDRPVAVVSEDLLRRWRVEELEEGLGLLRVLRRRRDRDRVLDEDGVLREHVVDRLLLLLSEDRVVLVV